MLPAGTSMRAPKHVDGAPTASAMHGGVLYFQSPFIHSRRFIKPLVGLTRCCIGAELGTGDSGEQDRASPCLLELKDMYPGSCTPAMGKAQAAVAAQRRFFPTPVPALGRGPGEASWRDNI